MTKGSGEALFSASPFFCYYDLEAKPNDWGDIQSVSMSCQQRFVSDFTSDKNAVMQEVLNVAIKLAQRECNRVKDNIHYIKLIAHNGGGYDHVFLLGYFFSTSWYQQGWRFEKLFVVQQSSIKFARFSKMFGNKLVVIELIDTYAIFPAPLWQYGLTIGMPKLEVDDWQNPEQVATYRRQDVAILETFCHVIERKMRTLGLQESCFGTYDRPIFTQTQLAKRLMHNFQRMFKSPDGKGDPFGYNNRWYAVGGNLKMWDSIEVKATTAFLRDLGVNFVEDVTPDDSFKASLLSFIQTFPNVTMKENKRDTLVQYSGLGNSRIGGLVAPLWRGFCPNISELDVTSMYPHNATKPLAFQAEALLKFPTVDALRAYHDKGYAVFLLAHYEVPTGLPIGPIPIKHDVTIRPVGSVYSGRYEMFELAEYVLAYGGKVRPLSAVIFTREPFAKDFFMRMWEFRKQAKREKDEGLAYASKIISNSLTGSYGKTPDNDGFEVTDIMSVGARITTKQEKPSPSVQPQTYIDITTKGQCLMLDIIYANIGKVLYVDTDGFKFRGEIDLCGKKVGDDLGDFKLEYENKEGYIVDSKCYAINKGDKEKPKWDIKFKAVPEQVFLSDTTVTEDGRRTKHFDIHRFRLIVQGYRCDGVRGMESIVQVLANMRTVREMIPENVWNDKTKEKDRLLMQYLPALNNRKGHKKRSVIDGFMPLETSNIKGINKRMSTTAIWNHSIPDWTDIFRASIEYPNLEIGEFSFPHQSIVILTNSYNAHCLQCGERRNIQVNVKQGLRCPTCEYSKITLMPTKQLTGKLVTMTKEFLLSCGFDKTIVRENSFYSYKHVPPTEDYLEPGEYIEESTFG